MGDVGLVDKAVDGGTECQEVGIIFGRQTFFFCKLPKSFDEIEVGRIGR